MPAVSLNNISKKYKIFSSRHHRLVEAASLGRVKRSREFWALKDVNLEVERGVSMGILGRNGAGKSTMLTIMSGVLQPTRGSVAVDGRLVALLQLGAGFRPEYTGRENAMLNGLILGIDRKEMIRRFDEIEAFADIGDFMDQPVKTYSSGMRARLGFAVAVNVEPDVLLVDETLSVGDAVFKHVGIQKMHSLREAGTTVLLVSHGLEMIREFCEEAVLLNEGRIISRGETSDALDHYQALVSEIEARRDGVAPPSESVPGSENGRPSPPSFKEDPALERSGERGLRHGTGKVRVKNVEILDEGGKPAEAVAPEAGVRIRVHLHYLEDTEASSLRIILRNKAGLDVFSTSTNLEHTSLGERRAGERVIVDFALEQLPLKNDTYSVTALVADPKIKNLYMDWVGVAAVFEVGRPTGRGPYRGLVHLPTEIEVFDASRAESPGQRA